MGDDREVGAPTAAGLEDPETRSRPGARSPGAAEVEAAARRYLEHLAEEGRVHRSPRYGTPGRPETEYRWRQ